MCSEKSRFSSIINRKILTDHERGNGIEQHCKQDYWACLHGGGGPQIGEVTCGGSPYLSCKRDQIKRDYMDSPVTPPYLGSPTSTM